MSLIKRLLKLFFGTNETNSSPITGNDYMADWEKERVKRIEEAETGLKSWLVKELKEKGNLAFTWESGNDEAFVTFKDSTEIDEDHFQNLEEYIIDKLEIPDAGEFAMTGEGTLYMEGSVVKASYASIMREVVDFNEETEEEIYGRSEEDKGERILFHF